MRAVAPVLALVLLSSCGNPCQRLCHRMKTFAEDCGYTVSDAELDTCVEQEQTASKEDKDFCREYGDLGVIERTWDCDSIADYWGAAATGS